MFNELSRLPVIGGRAPGAWAAVYSYHPPPAAFVVELLRLLLRIPMGSPCPRDLSELSSERLKLSLELLDMAVVAINVCELSEYIY